MHSRVLMCIVLFFLALFVFRFVRNVVVIISDLEDLYVSEVLGSHQLVEGLLIHYRNELNRMKLTSCILLI